MTPQAVTEPLTSDAIFLVVTVNRDDESRDTVRSLCGDVAGLVRAVSARDPGGRLSCIVGIGSEVWDRLIGAPRPAELHVLREIAAGRRVSVSTPGDILLHITSDRHDLNFELSLPRSCAASPGASRSVDEVHGFQFFDDRDLIGFVDGTENPVGAEAAASTIVGPEDASFEGGSYVIVQKYLHDLPESGRPSRSRSRRESSAGRSSKISSSPMT